MPNVWTETLKKLKNTATTTSVSVEGHLNDEGSVLAGVDCPICNNTGYIVYTDDAGCLTAKDCQCMTIRRNLKHIRDSKLGDMVEDYTLDRYETPTADNEIVKKAALQYINDTAQRRKWFYICGNPGTGKTHICVGICSALLARGMSLRYMLWREDIPKLKSNVNKPDEYEKLMKPFKNAEVLYIDDFLKGNVTEADLNIAFELLNHRYNQNKRTIISSERTIAEISRYDNALGGRIFQRTDGFCLVSPPVNWRAKGGKQK